MRMPQQLAVLGLAIVCHQSCLGADDTNVIAFGAWSEPVLDGSGNGLRGRLLMCAYPDHRGTSNRLDIGVYVELQECSDAFKGTVQVYCDFRAGFSCNLTNAFGKEPEPVGIGFSGGAPGASWHSLPPFASVRLRASTYAGGRLRDGSMGIWFIGSGAWTISAKDTNAYFLSGTFVLNPPPGKSNKDGTVWSGTLLLPRMPIPPMKIRP